MEISRMQKAVHQNSINKGFWAEEGQDRNKAEMIALMHSELSEALEAIRFGPGFKDKHLPDHDPVGIELADCVIRIMDYCEGFGINLEATMIAKANFNINRPHKHGKQF